MSSGVKTCSNMQGGENKISIKSDLRHSESNLWMSDVRQFISSLFQHNMKWEKCSWCYTFPDAWGNTIGLRLNWVLMEFFQKDGFCRHATYFRLRILGRNWPWVSHPDNIEVKGLLATSWFLLWELVKTSSYTILMSFRLLGISDLDCERLIVRDYIIQQIM